MKYINIILLLLLITIGIVKSDNYACSPFSEDSGQGPSTVEVTIDYEVCTIQDSCNTNTSTIVINRGVPHFINNNNNSSFTNETGTYYNVAFYYDGKNVCLYSNLTTRSLFFGNCVAATKCEVHCLGLDKANTNEEELGFSYYDTCNGLLSNKFEFSIFTDDEPLPPKKGCNEPSAPTNVAGPQYVSITYKNFIAINDPKVFSEGDTLTIDISTGVFWGNVDSNGLSDNAVYYDGEKVCIYSLFNNSDCTNDNSISCSSSCLNLNNKSERNSTIITSLTKNCETSIITDIGYYLTLTVPGENSGSSSASSSSDTNSSSSNTDSSSQDGSDNSSNKIINSITLLLSLIIISIII